jgi:hypothetical protein
MHSIYVSMYLAFRKGRRYTQLAARMSLIAPLHFVDRKRGGIDGVRRFGARVPKSLVRRSLAFGNAQVARHSQNLKLAGRSWQCGAGGVTTRTVDSRWKNTRNSTEQKSLLLPKRNGKIITRKRKKTDEQD